MYLHFGTLTDKGNLSFKAIKITDSCRCYSESKNLIHHIVPIEIKTSHQIVYDNKLSKWGQKLALVFAYIFHQILWSGHEAQESWSFWFFWIFEFCFCMSITLDACYKHGACRRLCSVRVSRTEEYLHHAETCQFKTSSCLTAKQACGTKWHTQRLACIWILTNEMEVFLEQ